MAEDAQNSFTPSPPDSARHGFFKFSGADLLSAARSNFGSSQPSEPVSNSKTVNFSLSNCLKTALEKAASQDSEDEDGSTRPASPRQDYYLPKHMQASQRERELRDAHQIRMVRERNDLLLQKFEMPPLQEPLTARGKGYTVLASARSARAVSHGPAPPVGARHRKRWWKGDPVPQTARPSARKLAPVSKKTPRTPKQCEVWMGRMQSRCIRNNLGPATISKVLGLKWRKFDTNELVPTAPGGDGPLRTLSARRRSVELSSDAAAFEFNKARIVDEVWARFCDASGTRIDIPRMKRALIVMGVKVESRQVGKHFTELVYKLERMDVEKATKEDFWSLLNLPHISKLVDDNVRRGTIQTNT